MKKYNVCVYAISKNEEKFVNRWVDSLIDADEIIVLDTGSTDNTVEALRKRGVEVFEQKVIPWRFDVARNMALDLIPKNMDICISIDLDEVLVEGWREILEESWHPNTTRARYHYTWSFNEDGSPGVTFYIDKIHSRYGYKWKNPVHEVLVAKENFEEKYINCFDMKCEHYPDQTKSRSGYLGLLELSINEDPYDDRNMHYLGREYMFYSKWDKCIETLYKHLNLPTAVWRDERCASMRYIARAYKAKNEYDESKLWLYRAIAEAPYLREPYIEMAMIEYEHENWPSVYHMIKEALKIEERTNTYIHEVSAWNHTPYDLGALSAYYLGIYKEALDYSRIAYEMNTSDERLKNNYDIIKNKLYSGI